MQSYIAAGMLALALGAAPVWAQATQPAPPAQTPENPPQKPKEKAKRVWTDDDIAALHGGVTSATITPAPEGAAAPEAAAPETAAPAAGPGKEKQVPPEKTAKYYQEKLAPLRKQLADTEAKIKEIQDALDNPYKGTNKIGLNQNAPPGPPATPDSNPPRADSSIYGNQIVRPQDQLAYYEKQKADIQQKIDDLESKALSNGLSRSEIQ